MKKEIIITSFLTTAIVALVVPFLRTERGLLSPFFAFFSMPSEISINWIILSSGFVVVFFFVGYLFLK
ncbi:MAG: hypothetical protein ACMXYF_02475 [Candidatus Woesearchaeota archaeon]